MMTLHRLGWTLLAASLGPFVPASAQEDPCTLVPDPGPCEAAIPAWYFDQDFGECTQFTWGGCAGTVPFETLEACVAAGCTSEFNLAGLCDSIAVVVTSVGDASIGHLEILVSPEYQTEYWFAYAGFALFDNEGNLLAAEDVSSAPNAYGFDGAVEPHVRWLEYQSGIDLSMWAPPFEMELRLLEGWMAGNPTARCHWVWNDFGAFSSMGELPFPVGPHRWETYDLLGRPAVPMPGQLRIQRGPEGRVRKVISE